MPPVLEGAPRELTGLGKPHATERGERLDDAARHGAAAMNVQLGDVLAGEARWPRQPEREPAVEQLAGPGFLTLRKLAWRGGGGGPHSARIASPAPGPEMRMTATPARPGPLASAQMVSRWVMVRTRHPFIPPLDGEGGSAGHRPDEPGGVMGQ